MLKLLGLDVVLAVAGNLYLLLALAGVCFALWKGKTWKLKVMLATLVLALSMAPIAPRIYQGIQYRNKLETVKTMFAERCKTAGEKIYRTVNDVDGIFLIKLRPKEANLGDQFKLDDPYGRDLDGQGYIETFVRGSYDLMRSQNPRPDWPPRVGYAFVDAIDPLDGQRYRYTGRIEQPSLTDKSYSDSYKRFVLEKTIASGESPRYGVTYDDISTHEDREHWIAGSSLKVIDLHNKEIVAERKGYMIDWAQGDTSGFRSPWLEAAENACPDFHRFVNPVVVVPGSSAQIRQAQDFVEKVLKPILK